MTNVTVPRPSARICSYLFASSAEARIIAQLKERNHSMADLLMELEADDREQNLKLQVLPKER